MITSTITSKGQTTIPKPIREKMGLSNHDRIAYKFEKEKVIITPLKGVIFGIRGSVKSTRRPENFRAIRETTRKRVGRSKS
ncbi:MAG: AbrB family transcriptional regulator [Kiritimatiellae bacterium]|nr:AbrB family transcriptional regulator [Kiritimatiellia bacterium]